MTPTGPNVTWNGVDVQTAGTTSSALTIDLTQAANLTYNWPASAGLTIKDVRLEMFYFGYAVTTRDVFLSPVQDHGPVALDWTPLSISYVLEGGYRLTASLIASNHTTMWSENFYVRGNAPLGILALLPIVLLVIIVYELYGLVRSGRYAMLGRTARAPAPSKPPEETPPNAPTTPPESPGGNTPPSGGSS
jgi:hypothetical protein